MTSDAAKYVDGGTRQDRSFRSLFALGCIAKSQTVFSGAATHYAHEWESWMARRMRGCFDLNIDHAVHKGKKSPHHCTIGRTLSHRRRHRTIGYGEIVEVLAPVVQREIYYRMLRAE